MSDLPLTSDKLMLFIFLGCELPQLDIYQKAKVWVQYLLRYLNLHSKVDSILMDISSRNIQLSSSPVEDLTCTSPSVAASHFPFWIQTQLSCPFPKNGKFEKYVIYPIVSSNYCIFVQQSINYIIMLIYGIGNLYTKYGIHQEKTELFVN